MEMVHVVSGLSEINLHCREGPALGAFKDDHQETVPLELSRSPNLNPLALCNLEISCKVRPMGQRLVALGGRQFDIGAQYDKVDETEARATIKRGRCGGRADSGSEWR